MYFFPVHHSSFSGMYFSKIFTNIWALTIAINGKPKVIHIGNVVQNISVKNRYNTNGNALRTTIKIVHPKFPIAIIKEIFKFCLIVLSN